MNLDSAVERLQAAQGAGLERVFPGLDQALALAVEAVRRIQAIRMTDYVEAITRLPGETEE